MTAPLQLATTRRKWQPSLLPCLRDGRVTAVPHDPLLQGRVRYDARGNRIEPDATVLSHPSVKTKPIGPTGVTGVSGVLRRVMYALTTPDGQFVAGGEESEIEALYDLFMEEYGELEIVPCQ